MSEAVRDQNRVTSLLFESSTSSGTTVPAKGDQTTGRLLVDMAGGTGTVTSVATGTGLTGGPITTTGTISLATSLQPMATLTGNSLKVLRVNVGETAVEYASVGSGTVTSASVVSANGFAGTVATATTTPAITLTTTITGLLKGNGTAISAASAGTDYVAPGAITTSGLTMATAKMLGRATAATGAIEEIAVTGSGSAVLGTTPTIATPVINGLATGTGVASAATASTLMSRDANANTFVNNIFANSASTVSASGTTVLTVASARFQSLTGTLSQTFQLPDATTLTNGHIFTFNNNSSGSLIITNNGTTTLYTAPGGGYTTANLLDNSTANGSWDFHASPPSTVTWGSGTTGLVFNTALTTSPSIAAGASSSTAPSFIPQRGSATTGLGGDSTNLYLILGGSSKFSVDSTGHITVEGVTSTGATGTGKMVFDTSPTLVTPTLGVASATTINKVTLTAPATGSTLTIADGKTLTANNSITIAGTDAKTLTVSNSLTLAGTDSTTMTFPSTSATIARTDAAQTFTGAQTFSNAVIYTNNAITASGNAATVPITAKLNTVTNNSAATLTITMTTTSATDGQMTIVRILDFSAAAQTITWVNTENSTVSAPTTSNGSTTLPLTVGFMYNSATSKWRCIASA